MLALVAKVSCWPSFICSQCQDLVCLRYFTENIIFLLFFKSCKHWWETCDRYNRWDAHLIAISPPPESILMWCPKWWLSLSTSYCILICLLLFKIQEKTSPLSCLFKPRHESIWQALWFWLAAKARQWRCFLNF